MSEQKLKNYAEKPHGSFRKRLILSVIFGLIVFIALSLYADIGDVSQAFAGFEWRLIPAILTLTVLNYLLRFYKWDYYLKNIGIRIKARDSLAIFLSGLTMSVTPAKLGEVFKAYLLKRLNGTPVSRSVPVVLADFARQLHVAVMNPSAALVLFWKSRLTDLIMHPVNVMTWFVDPLLAHSVVNDFTAFVAVNVCTVGPVPVFVTVPCAQYLRNLQFVTMNFSVNGYINGPFCMLSIVLSVAPAVNISVQLFVNAGVNTRFLPGM
jgi:hypothetical protein